MEKLYTMAEVTLTAENCPRVDPQIVRNMCHQIEQFAIQDIRAAIFEMRSAFADPGVFKYREPLTLILDALEASLQ